MRKIFKLKGLIAASALVFGIAGCSSNGRDAVQVNSPAPEVLRGASLSTTNPNAVVTNGPASMTSSSVDAYAIAAANQNRDGRVLGPAYLDGPSPSGNYTPPTGQLVPPALIANPQVTVNSSISSPPTPIVTGDGLGGLVVAAAPATTAGV